MKHTDTLDIQFAIKTTVKDNIKSKLVPNSDEEYGVIYEGKHPSELYSFFYICNYYVLIVKVKHKAMAGIESAKILQEQIIKMITEYFNICRDDIIEVVNVKNNGKIKPINYVGINRIEYKNDYRTKSNDEIFVIEDIQRISTDSWYNYEQFSYDYSENENSRINTVYAKDGSGYVAITGYFKEYEQLEKEDAEIAEKYKGIFRTEVKLKNGHLNYKKRVRNKTLQSYFNEEVAEEYFKKYAQKIYYTEPFYRIDIAIGIIYENKELKDFMKARLSEFLTKINEDGITQTRKSYDSKTFRNYINKVRAIGINPLCFSPIIEDKVISIEKMDNFIMFENSIKEDI
jgi:hypothetical protein